MNRAPTQTWPRPVFSRARVQTLPSAPLHDRKGLRPEPLSENTDYYVRAKARKRWKNLNLRQQVQKPRLPRNRADNFTLQAPRLPAAGFPRAECHRAKTQSLGKLGLAQMGRLADGLHIITLNKLSHIDLVEALGRLPRDMRGQIHQHLLEQRIIHGSKFSGHDRLQMNSVRGTVQTLSHCIILRCDSQNGAPNVNVPLIYLATTRVRAGQGAGRFGRATARPERPAP
jgi:hypothetical protein